MPSPKRLTKMQVHYLKEMHEEGYIPHGTGYRTMPRNKSMWALDLAGLAYWTWGPPNSFLRTYCFMPRWTNPVC